MCGIAGNLNRGGEPASAVILHRMTDAIAHRGPDGEGAFVEGPVALGHRRLAIIDLSPTGHQPMMTPDGRFVLSYNGEVYNFNALRLELEALGRQFRSRTDSEVILHALAEWGTAAIARFNGMFALALWDRQRQELLLARDRYGVKPLYYAQMGERLLFGSEIKAILAHPEARATLDAAGLVEYLTFQNFFTDHTLFQGVRLLPAGCFLRVSLGGASLAPVRYWDYQFVEPDAPVDEAAALEELDRLFVQDRKSVL